LLTEGASVLYKVRFGAFLNDVCVKLHKIYCRPFIHFCP